MMNELLENEILNFVNPIINKLNSPFIQVSNIIEKVIMYLPETRNSKVLENLIISICQELSVKIHYHYAFIASHLMVQQIHRDTHDDYEQVIEIMLNYQMHKKPSPMINEGFYNFAKQNIQALNDMLHYERDYDIDIYGLISMMASYLKRVNGVLYERPQHMFLRVAIALHYRHGDLNDIRKTYDLFSQGYCIHGTPTLFNAGTVREQLSSCFLLGIGDDMKSIGKCLTNTALISQSAGGIGIHMTNIRPLGADILSVQGSANGLRCLPIFNGIGRYANQCNKRNGSIAIYLEPWHGDFMYVLGLRTKEGSTTEKARDLFYGLMINDIYMQRVQEDGIWSFMCSKRCKKLLNQFGEAFTEQYIRYENKGKFIHQMKARDLHFEIMKTQIEIGMPYIIFKDAVNRKTNQSNLGVINSSNLCTEIMQVSNKNEYSTCNLASICLKRFVSFENDKPIFDYDKLYETAKQLVVNLDNVIDITDYPVPKYTKDLNANSRPIGIGVQGLANVFALFNLPFDSTEARKMNSDIFETIYYGCMKSSIHLAKVRGPYPYWQGSPSSHGLFQFDLWQIKPHSNRYNWSKLSQRMVRHGLRNCLTTTCMPTAGTSQIMGNSESFMPLDNNIFVRVTNSGENYVINHQLVDALVKLDLWNQSMRDRIKFYGGSIQEIMEIPYHIRQVFRTVYEIPQKSLIEMEADRGIYIDQSQSADRYLIKPNFVLLNSMLFYAWQKGLKTGMYYLRSKPGKNAKMFGLDPDTFHALSAQQTHKAQGQFCKIIGRDLNTGEVCYSCSG